MKEILMMELQDAQHDLKLVTEQYDQLKAKLSQMDMEDPKREMEALRQGVALGQQLQLQNQIGNLERLLRVIRKTA